MEGNSGSTETKIFGHPFFLFFSEDQQSTEKEFGLMLHTYDDDMVKENFSFAYFTHGEKTINNMKPIFCRGDFNAKPQKSDSLLTPVSSSLGGIESVVPLSPS